MNAAWESLHLASQELASCSNIKQRLITAFSKHLEELDAQQLPKEMRGEFQSIIRQMTCVRPLRGETAVVATVRKMSVEEAGACAQRIVGLLSRLGGSHSAAVPARPQAVVSRYAADA